MTDLSYLDEHSGQEVLRREHEKFLLLEDRRQDKVQRLGVIRAYQAEWLQPDETVATMAV